MGKWKYGIVLDAGSSGTRIYIYKWLNPHRARKHATEPELHSLPKLKSEKHWTKKIHPGIATFGEKPTEVGPEYLQQLFDHALENIPPNEIEHTPVFLLATAGMRLLEQTRRKILLDHICNYAQTHTKFQLPDCDLHIQVIPGETEGLYGWIAANYLLGGFDQPADHDHGKDHHTYGFLDMGGASAQIAFAPNATEAEKHANDLQLLRLRTIAGEQKEYKVFVTTWLGFGVNEARRRYVDALLESSPSDTVELPDPCLPSGLTVTAEGKQVQSGSEQGKSKKPYLLGTGKFDECLRQTYPLLDKDAPCPDAPCLLHGVHVPAIDFDVNHFVGVSEYWHTTHEIFEMGHKDKAYDFHTYQKRVNEFCSQPWSAIASEVKKKTWGKKVDEKTALEVCFKASWLINVLHDGIGIPRVGLEHLDSGHNGTKEVLDKAKQKGFLDPFQAVNKIDDVEVSWTLGKMVLYAASQVPPADGALAVGFGSNEVGKVLPSDFQPAGGEPLPLDSADIDGDDDDDWHETLFKDSPRRIPGLVIFLIIIIVALFILCGRDGRKTSLQRIRRVFGRPGGSRKRRVGGLSGPIGKLFGGQHTPTYDRLVEEGEAANDFELPEIDSDNDHSDSSSAGSSRVGRTSGWATPKMQAGFEPTATYFESGGAAQAGHALLPPSAIDREGLMSRTDSRERLAVERDKKGRRSRNVSPIRSRGSMIGIKASVD